jgi:hypothetical protein
MFGPFSQNDLALLFRLIVAHLIVDFMFQMDSWLKQKSQKKWTSSWLYIHGALNGILAYTFAGFWTAMWLPITIFISHVLLDGLKNTVEDTARVFLLDQLGHFIVILVCWLLLVNVEIKLIAKFLIILSSDIKFWILIFSYITVIWPASLCIGKITEPWRKKIEKTSPQGLEKAGLWIGRLERVLILTFVLLKHFEAIGFLIAAKSVFRFGDIRSSDDRKEAEYFLVGTMISFIIAIILGIFTSWIFYYQSVSVK